MASVLLFEPRNILACCSRLMLQTAWVFDRLFWVKVAIKQLCAFTEHDLEIFHQVTTPPDTCLPSCMNSRGQTLAAGRLLQDIDRVYFGKLAGPLARGRARGLTGTKIHPRVEHINICQGFSVVLQ